MSTPLLAVYENGMLRPAQLLPFADGETLEITVARLSNSEVPLAEDEAIRRIRAAKTLEELFAAADAAEELEPDDGYDVLKALDENRKREGAYRMLFPPEMKGISW